MLRFHLQECKVPSVVHTVWELASTRFISSAERTTAARNIINVCPTVATEVPVLLMAINPLRVWENNAYFGLVATCAGAYRQE